MRKAGAKFEVLLMNGAETDLEALYEYIAESDNVANADHVLDRLLETVDTLSRFPERGPYPKELSSLGIKDFRQTTFKPYRIIYRIVDRRVFVYLIADGRRDMQALLARRLLSA